jgi:hypothetical protein
MSMQEQSQPMEQERMGETSMGEEMGQNGMTQSQTTQTQQQDDRASMNEPLLSAGDGETFKQRWEQIQVTFVDEPQTSVREADALVQELMQRLADSFAQERSRLEEQWERGEQASTEDLRTALQQYRSFFRRLLVA